MTTKRELVLSAIYRSGGMVEFNIVHQSHRCRQFSDGMSFGASNGITLCSWMRPEWHQKNATLFVCGEDNASDKIGLTCTRKQFQYIADAVAEYNERYSKEDTTPDEVESALSLFGVNEGIVRKLLKALGLYPPKPEKELKDA